jgi:hypothetical protein
MDPAEKARRAAQAEVLCGASLHGPAKKARARHHVGPGGIFTIGKVHSVHSVHSVHPVQFVQFVHFVHRFSFSLSSPNP